MGNCSVICADEADKVFFVCAFNHVLGVYRIREGVNTEGSESRSERQKKGKTF